MPRDVNVNLSNFRTTGINVSIAQRAVDVSATWTKDDGTQGSTAQTVLFPNFLANRSAAWLKRKLTQLMYESLRIDAGLDDEDSQP